MRSRIPFLCRYLCLAACLAHLAFAAPAAAQDAANPASAAAPASVTAPAPASDSAAECPLKIYARLEMIDLASGLFAIPVKVEDRDLYFLVDTGGYINTISQAVVDDLKLTPVPAKPVYGVGLTMNSYVVPKSFAMGPIGGNDLPFYVEALTLPGLAGALAPETMSKFDVDFDFVGGKLSIFSPDHCPQRVVYWTKDMPIVAAPMDVDKDRHVSVAAKLDGKDIRVMLDTGSNNSFVSLSAARRYLGVDEKTEGVVEQDRMLNNARQKTYSYPFQTLTIGDIAIDKPSVIILEDAALMHMGTDLILGMNVLRQLHFYIAYKEGKLYVTPASAH